MMKKRVSKSLQKCDLKQTDIFTGIKNLRKLKNKQTMLKRSFSSPKIISPIVWEVTNSDSDTEEPVEKNILPKRKLPVPISDDEDEDESQRFETSICLNKPNANSTPNFSAGITTLQKNICLNILSNTIITPTKNDTLVNETLNNLSTDSQNTPKNNTNKTNADTPTVSQNKPKNNTNQTNADTPTDSQNTPKNNTNNSKVDTQTETQKTPNKNTNHSKVDTPSSSPKKEKKGIKKSFLKINNELISSVFQSKSMSKLLSQEDIRMLKIIQRASPEYQYVCFKLYKWLPKWYNLSKYVNLIKLDLPDKEIVALFNFLKDNDIVETDYTMEDNIFLLNLLDLEDIKSICKTFKIKAPKLERKTGTYTTKPLLIDLLIKNCTRQSTLTILKSTEQLLKGEIIKKFGKHVVRIKENFKQSFHKVFILATFTNPQMYKIDDFFRHMAENVDFPEYEIQDHVVFYSPSEFLSYVKAREFRDQLDDTKTHLQQLEMGRNIFKNLKEFQDDNDLRRYETVPHLKRFTAKSVYISSLGKISEKLLTKFPEEVKDWLEFLVETFSDSHRLGCWYYNLCKIYNALKDPGKAVELIITALRDKKVILDEIQIENLGERGQILKSRVNQYQHDILIELLPMHIKQDDFPEVTIEEKTIRGNAPGRRRDYVVIDSEGNKVFKKVEDVALDYYINKCGYTGGAHCEGSIITALFALFFLDLIYNPEILIPGTFLSKMQAVPLDFYTTYFYVHRKEAINQRLEEIKNISSDEGLLNFAKKNWEMFSHKTSFCRIDNIDTKFLEILVNCISGKILAKIFERLVKDFRQYKSGMPDLLVWDTRQNKAKFVEVKGENDRLSIKQKLWLKYLEAIGANIEVCYVHSTGSKKKLKKEEKVTPKKKIVGKKVSSNGESDLGNNSTSTHNLEDKISPQPKTDKIKEKKSTDKKTTSKKEPRQAQDDLKNSQNTNAAPSTSEMNFEETSVISSKRKLDFSIDQNSPMTRNEEASPPKKK